MIPEDFFRTSRYPPHQSTRWQGYHAVPAVRTIQEMNQRLRSFLAIRVDGEELFLESFDTRPEEGLDLVVQVEKLHAQQLRHSLADRRLATQLTPVTKTRTGIPRACILCCPNY